MHGFREGIKNLKPEELKELNRKIISKSRENKVYRAGTIDGLVVVGIKLINRLKESYGRGIDVIVADALYLNDKFLKTIEDNKYKGIIRLKGNNNSLLENAEGLFKSQKPKEWKTKRKVVNTNIHQSRKIKAWSDKFEYVGRKIKVVKYEEEYKKSGENQKDIIYVISTDEGMTEETINKIIHARWDIENNGFN